MINLEKIKAIFKPELKFYNSRDLRYKTIIDLRNPDYAIIAGNTDRSYSKKQYIVVERNKTKGVRVIPEELHSISRVSLGTSFNLIKKADMELFSTWHSVDDPYFIFKDYNSDKFFDTSEGATLSDIIAFASIKNSEEIFDKLKKANLTVAKNWPEFVQDSTKTSLKEIFGPKEFRVLQKMSVIFSNIKISYYDVDDIVKTIRKVFYTFDIPEFDQLVFQLCQWDRTYSSYNTRFLLKAVGTLMNYTTLNAKQLMTIADAVKRQSLDYQGLDYLKDYLSMKNQLKDYYDSSKLPILPNNLQGGCYENFMAIKNKHDFILTIYRRYQQFIIENRIKEQQELYKKNVLDIAKMFEWENDKYIIKAPRSLTELTTEGKELNHCVGSYIDSVSKGNEYILFFREKSNPEVPYFTIDIDPTKHVRQIHGRSNCNVPSDLMPIFKEWAEKVEVNMGNTNGVLCARRV